MTIPCCHSKSNSDTKEYFSSKLLDNSTMLDFLLHKIEWNGYSKYSNYPEMWSKRRWNEVVLKVHRLAGDEIQRSAIQNICVAQSKKLVIFDSCSTFRSSHSSYMEMDKLWAKEDLLCRYVSFPSNQSTCLQKLKTWFHENRSRGWKHLGQGNVKNITDE